MSRTTDKVRETIAMRTRGTTEGAHNASPLAGPIYTVPKKPKECTSCGRKGMAMEQVNDGLWECSALFCPHRKGITATKARP